MSFSLSVCLLAAALTALLGLWEWRRRDSNLRLLRIVAVGTSGLALALLGLASRSPEPEFSDENAVITLVTEGAGERRPTGGQVVDLGTVPSGDVSLSLVPDAAFLRRARPSVTEFRIEGSGVTSADAAALEGQRVTRVGEIRVPSTPLFDVVTPPGDVVLGDAVRIQGRVVGLEPGTAATVALEAPDGTVRTTELVSGPDGRGVFVAEGGVPVAIGSFEWRLRLGARGESVTIGVNVVPAVGPRILFWESAPSTESARLRRWLGELGTSVSARVQVSADRVRTTGSDVAERRILDAGLLAGQDVLICDANAFSQFTGAELVTLRQAVRDHGLGLLIVAGPTPLAERAEFPLPWILVEDPSASEESARRSRLRLFDGSRLEEPVGVLRATIAEGAAGRRLATDPLDRAVATRFAEGRGYVAVSLVQDSWRWLQQGQGQTYARFWTVLLSSLARPLAAERSWRMLETDGISFVDQPVRFVSSEPGDRPGPLPFVLSPDPTIRTTLISAGDREFQFWPRIPGWHHLATEGGVVLQSFYVQPPQALPGVREELRRRMTDRLVVDSPAGAAPALHSADSRSGLQRYALLILLGTLAGLWIEERWRKRL